jgi:carbonic anhydrase
MKPRHLLILCTLGLAAIGCQGPQTTEPAPVATEHHEPQASEEEDLWPQNGDEALEWLLAGNERFVAGTPRHDHESMRRRMSLSNHQRPFAIVLGCADARVPPELVFDHGLGDLFVIRVAGNVVSDDEAGSIEYAAAHLDTPLVVVLGHEGCGAVTAALGSIDDEPEELVTLMQKVRPALSGIDRSLPKEDQVRAGVESNVHMAMGQLQEIAEREQRPSHERMKVVGAVYELETGRVRVLE